MIVREILKSSLWLILPELGPSHQPVITHSWMWEAMQLAGLAHSPTHQHTSYYSSPEPQLPLDPTPLTHWETPMLGPPGPPSRQWAGQLQLQDP